MELPSVESHYVIRYLKVWSWEDESGSELGITYISVYLYTYHQRHCLDGMMLNTRTLYSYLYLKAKYLKRPREGDYEKTGRKRRTSEEYIMKVREEERLRMSRSNWQCHIQRGY